MVKHTVFISLLFTISVQAFEPPSESRRPSASQAGDQLSQFEQEFQQALERIAALESENNYLAERLLTSTDEKRELERENEQIKKELNFESSGNEFHSKLVPIAYVVGGITATFAHYAKKDAPRIDSILLETVGKIVTNPNIARAVAPHFPSLYKWQTTCCNNSISIHINPIDFVWTSGESFYNYKYHYKNTVDAESSGTTSETAVQLTACQLAKKLVRGIHITLTDDPIAPIPGTTYTLITTDQLVRSVLKTAADETEHFVMHRIQGMETKPDHISHFAKNLAKQMSAEAAYNIIAQTAHGITRDSDYNYHVALIFPSDLQERKTFLQSWTKFVIKWLLINGTPYVYDKISAQPSA